MSTNKTWGCLRKSKRRILRTFPARVRKVGGVVTRLKGDFMPDGTELGKAHDNTGEAAGTKTAANASMSDDQLDELFQRLKTLSAGQPELRHCLVRHMLLAEEAIEGLTATSLAHPSAAAATSTKRQDDTRVSSRHTFFADPREGVGYIWAKQHGYAHVNQLGEREAREVLSFLKVADDMYSDSLGDLVTYDNAWCWLEAYANAGGDLQNLKIKQDFNASPFYG